MLSLSLSVLITLFLITSSNNIYLCVCVGLCRVMRSFQHFMQNVMHLKLVFLSSRFRISIIIHLARGSLEWNSIFTFDEMGNVFFLGRSQYLECFHDVWKKIAHTHTNKKQTNRETESSREKNISSHIRGNGINICWPYFHGICVLQHISNAEKYIYIAFFYLSLKHVQFCASTEFSQIGPNGWNKGIN